MSTRIVTQKVHAYIDYPVAFSLIGMPFLLGLGINNPTAFALSFYTGIAALILTIFTKHELGIIKILPYSFHLSVDRIVGITFLLAPFFLDFNTFESAYYWANSAAVLAVTFVLNTKITEEKVSI